MKQCRENQWCYKKFKKCAYVLSGANASGPLSIDILQIFELIGFIQSQQLMLIQMSKNE